MKEIKNIATFFYKKRIILLIIILSSVSFLHIFWIVKASGDGEYFFNGEDEVIYYASAKLFSQTNSVQAESCIDENVSKIGRMNWYGPGYNIIYGTLFKIFGSHPAAFPWFHFFLGVAMIGTVFLFPIVLELRLLIAIGLIVTQQFCVYIFSYFPETLILFLATILTMLLMMQYRSQQDERKKRIYFFVFVFSVFLFMLCRITFIFWLAGLIGLSNNYRSLILRTILFFSGVVVSLIYMKLFIAPAWAGEMHKIDLLYRGEIFEFVYQTLKAFVNNLLALFKGRTSVINVLLGLIISGIILFVLYRHKLLAAALLISSCIMTVMFAYYTVSHFFFIKQTAMLIPLLLTAVVCCSSKGIGYLTVLILLLVFPSPIRKTNEAIEDGRNAYQHYASHKAFEQALLEIPQHIQEQSTVILWCYREYDYGYAAEALLPFSTLANEPILYTTNIVDPGADPETKFVLHRRLKIDYILSRHIIRWTNLKEIHSNEFYHLYQLLETNPKN